MSYSVLSHRESHVLLLYGGMRLLSETLLNTTGFTRENCGYPQVSAGVSRETVLGHCLTLQFKGVSPSQGVKPVDYHRSGEGKTVVYHRSAGCLTVSPRMGRETLSPKHLWTTTGATRVNLW